MVGPAILLGLLLLCAIYAVPVLLTVAGLRNLLAGQSRKKPIKGAIQLVVAIGLFYYLLINSYLGKKQEEIEKLGTYELVEYPKCYPCVLELQEDNVFVVKSGSVVKETGTWRYESGQDYFITYLNEHDRLGSGKYQYTNYKLKHPRPRP